MVTVLRGFITSVTWKTEYVEYHLFREGQISIQSNQQILKEVNQLQTCKLYDLFVKTKDVYVYIKICIILIRINK